jgi:hypothetical protein
MMTKEPLLDPALNNETLAVSQAGALHAGLQVATDNTPLCSPKTSFSA